MKLKKGQTIFTKNDMEFVARITKIEGNTVFVEWDCGDRQGKIDKKDLRKDPTGYYDFEAGNWTIKEL